MTRMGFASVLVALSGCNVPEPEPGTGGTDAGVVTGSVADAGASCGRGAVVVGSDYLSTNVSLVGVDGEVLSESFVSSATSDVGLAAPLSGDVVVPTQPSSGRSVTIIDRSASSILWFDVATAETVAHASVATGFMSNPRDVALVNDEAYVTRFEPNRDAGREPFDMGSDIVVVDIASGEIEASIDLSVATADLDARFLARPDKIVAVGDLVYALLGPLTADFAEAAPSRIVAIDPRSRAVTDVLIIEQLAGCSGLAVSPSGDRLAVACSGTFGGDSNATTDDSGIAVIDLVDSLSERRRYLAGDLGGRPISFFIDFASSESLVFATFGELDSSGEAAIDDTLVDLDLSSEEPRVVLRSEATAFTLGDVYCVAACAMCFVADAERQGGVVHRFDVGSDGRLGVATAIEVETRIGLPPRFIGGF